MYRKASEHNTLLQRLKSIGPPGAKRMTWFTRLNISFLGWCSVATMFVPSDDRLCKQFINEIDVPLSNPDVGSKLVQNTESLFLRPTQVDVI